MSAYGATGDRSKEAYALTSLQADGRAGASGRECASRPQSGPTGPRPLPVRRWRQAASAALAGNRGSRHFNRTIVGLDTGARYDFSEPKSGVSRVVSIDATKLGA